MRRSIWIATFVACLMVPSAFAQMRGGRVSAPVARPAFARPAPSRVFITQPHFPPVFHAGFGFRPVVIHHFGHRRFFSSGFWWPGFYGYAGYYGTYGYPDESASYDASQNAYLQQNQQLENEIARLSDEVERLRDEQEQARYAPPVPPLPPQPPRAEKAAPAEPTTLVFRNGQRQQVENYAIAGQTLWIFTEQRARKLPLSELDVPATQKANEEVGIDFAVPRK